MSGTDQQHSTKKTIRPRSAFCFAVVVTLIAIGGQFPYALLPAFAQDTGQQTAAGQSAAIDAGQPAEDPLNLGEFELPLEYAPGEEEGRGWLCPSLQPAPKQRAMFIVRQEMIATTEPEGETIPIDLLFPAPRNLGEQRRLASRIRVKFGSHDDIDAPERLLDYTAELIYSQPYNNPFIRVRFNAPHGEVIVHVDSWISSMRPSPGKVDAMVKRFARTRRSPQDLEEFNETYKITPIIHWAKPEAGQPTGPDIVKAAGETPFALAQHVVQQTASLVPYQAGLHMTDPFQVMTADGGDAESRATVVWYALQHEMPSCQVSGYERQFVDTTFAGFDAWNAMVLDGYAVADVGSAEDSYLGHDHAQYVATSIGMDHILEEYPQVPRHMSYSAGLYFHNEGRVTIRQYASLVATSGLAFDLPNGRYTFPKAEGAVGRGAAAEELDAELRDPPPGIIALAEQVARQRQEVNQR